MEAVSEENFKTVEYRWFPDAGNRTSYVYENADYIARGVNSQVIVAVKPLPEAKVGDEYTVRLLLHTSGAVSYAIDDKVIKIVS